MVIRQLLPCARGAGHTAAVAAFAPTVGAVGDAGERIFAGLVSGLIGRLNTLRITLVISAGALPALFLWRSDGTLFYVLL